MKVLAPVEGEEAALEDLVDRIVDHFSPGRADPAELAEAALQVDQVADSIAAPMKPALRKLAAFLRPTAP